MEELISRLDSICSKRNGPDEAWQCETDGDPVLYIEFYDNKYWGEIEEKEWQNLVNKLGCEPNVSVTVDISGRHDGRKELYIFLESLLGEHEGYIMDDYTDYASSLNEIKQGHIIDGHSFFDYNGWFEARAK